MDSAKSGSENGVPSSTGLSLSVSSEGDSGSDRQPEENSGSFYSEVGQDPQWLHDQKISFNNVIPSLIMIKDAVEGMISDQKKELERLTNQLSKYRR